MSNRTLGFLTALVILCMIVLFAINLNSILSGQPINQKYLQYNEVRGMAITRHKVLYTLNFEQQNEIVGILNQAIPINVIEGERTPANIEQLIIYQFQELPDIVLTPIGYVGKDMIFAAPQWTPNGYLKELSEGTLQKLLTESYD